jgi:hypothetical protein
LRWLGYGYDCCRACRRGTRWRGYRTARLAEAPAPNVWRNKPSLLNVGNQTKDPDSRRPCILLPEQQAVSVGDETSSVAKNRERFPSKSAQGHKSLSLPPSCGTDTLPREEEMDQDRSLDGPEYLHGLLRGSRGRRVAKSMSKNTVYCPLRKVGAPEEMDQD